MTGRAGDEPRTPAAVATGLADLLLRASVKQPGQSDEGNWTYRPPTPMNVASAQKQLDIYATNDVRSPAPHVHPRSPDRAPHVPLVGASLYGALVSGSSWVVSLRRPTACTRILRGRGAIAQLGERLLCKRLASALLGPDSRRFGCSGACAPWPDAAGLGSIRMGLGSDPAAAAQWCFEGPAKTTQEASDHLGAWPPRGYGGHAWSVGRASAYTERESVPRCSRSLPPVVARTIEV